MAPTSVPIFANADLLHAPHVPLPSPQIIKYPSERRDVDTLAMWVKTVAGTN